MLKTALAITAALVISSCASSDEVNSTAQSGGDVPAVASTQVDESPSTTAATPPTVTTTTQENATPENATTTSVANEIVDAVDNASAITIDESAIEDQEHLTRPWFADVSGDIENITFDNPAELFNGQDLSSCSGSGAYDLIDRSLTFRRDVTSSDFEQLQMSGYVQAGESAVEAIDQVIASGPCFDEAAFLEDPELTGSTRRGPTPTGIANSAVIDVVEGDLSIQVVVATTGGRDIHVTATISALLSDTGVPESELVSLLEDLAARSGAASQRVAFCSDIYGADANGDNSRVRIEDQECDGFDEYSPELSLLAYEEPRESTITPELLDNVELLVDPEPVEPLPAQTELAALNLLLRPSDFNDDREANLSLTSVPATTLCERELGLVAEVGNQFDQWLYGETRVLKPDGGEHIFHVAGEAPHTAAAVDAVEALAAYEKCSELTELLGADTFESRLLEGLPTAVAAGAVWELVSEGERQIVGDFAVEGGAVMAISLSGPNATEKRVRELLDVSLSRFDDYQVATKAR